MHLPWLDEARMVAVETGGALSLIEVQDGLLRVDGAARPSFEMEASDTLVVRALEPEGEATRHRGRLVLSPRRGGAALRAVVELPLEDYVEGVVCAELPIWSAEPAELEAQAIAARSYAWASLEERRALRQHPLELEAGTLDQAYRGLQDPGQNRGHREALERVREAVAATRGRVLEFEGRILLARYHAACGGQTTPLGSALPEARDGARAPLGAPCPACAAGETTETTWEASWKRTELDHLAATLGLGPHLLRLDPTIDASGRWTTVRVHGSADTTLLSGDELRRRLGRAKMKSTLVDRAWPHAGDAIEGGLLLAGRGHGHGVGLCQKGSRVLARDYGFSAARILAQYYPGCTIGNLPR